MADQYIDSFENADKQRLVTDRVKQSVRAGMVQMLNVGFKKDHRIYYPQHQMTVTMPEPGSVFLVPAEVAQYMLRMFPRKVQPVHKGQQPANFTPPPGYILVPIEPINQDVDESNLLVDSEE